jgi:hypothetical protein
MKGWKKIYRASGPRKQAGVAILISDKVDFKPTLIKRDKEGHSILIFFCYMLTLTAVYMEEG